MKIKNTLILLMVSMAFTLYAWSKDQPIEETSTDSDHSHQASTSGKSPIISKNTDLESKETSIPPMKNSKPSSSRVVWTSLPTSRPKQEVQIGESERWVDAGVVSRIDSRRSGPQPTPSDDRGRTQGGRPASRLILILTPSKNAKPQPNESQIPSFEMISYGNEEQNSDPLLTHEEIRQLLEKMKKKNEEEK